MFMDLNKEDRTKWVASLLGCSPNHPDTWPTQIIDSILNKCSAAVERTLFEEVRRLTHKAPT